MRKERDNFKPIRMKGCKRLVRAFLGNVNKVKRSYGKGADMFGRRISFLEEGGVLLERGHRVNEVEIQPHGEGKKTLVARFCIRMCRGKGTCLQGKCKGGIPEKKKK